MKDYNVEFSWNILWVVENKHFDYPFWDREKTLCSLELFSNIRDSVLIAIDWSKFTSNIISIDGTNYNYDSVNFLKSWVDGVILSWLNDVKRERLFNKSYIWIILWVADCAPIIWSMKNWESVFNLHVWYKWLFWNWEIDNPWILYNFFEKLSKNNISISDLEKIHLWPMAWNDFELPFPYYHNLSKYFFQNYRLLNPNDYFFLNWNQNEKWDDLWNFDLRRLIIDIIKYHWVSQDIVSSSGIDTTNLNNNWPSYRLFSKSLQAKNNRLSASIRKMIK